MSVFLSRLGVLIAVLALIAYGVVAVPMGLSADSDSALLLHAAEHWFSSGEYVRSRTSGFPLYEAVLLACTALGGSLLVVNALSLLMAIGAALLAHRLVVEENEWRGCLILILFLTYPLFMISSAEPMETMLSVLLALALVQQVISRPTLDIVHAALAVLLVLARLDAALLIITIVCARMEYKEGRNVNRSLIWLFGVGAFSILAYMTINQGFDFLSTKTMGFDTWWRRVARAFAGSINALQLTGLMALMIWFRHIRLIKASAQPLVFMDRLLVWVWALYGLRFLLLPDEIFYLIIPVLLLLVCATRILQPSMLLIASLVIMGGMQSLVSMSLFERASGVDDSIYFRPKINDGPLLQEFRARKAFSQLRDPVARKQVECYLFPDCPEMSLSHTAPYLHTADNKRAAVSARYLYVFFSGRYPRLIDQGFEEIRVCDEEVVPGPAWRIWQPGIDNYLVDIIAARQTPHCRTLLLSGHQASWAAITGPLTHQATRSPAPRSPR